MAKTISRDRLTGVWSATPTPFTNSWDIDTAAVKRLIEHHIKLGVKGLFIAGTCGEGPWMSNAMRDKMVATSAEYSKGRLLLAVQVTANSTAQILENMEAVKENGGDIAVIAPPYFAFNGTPENLSKLTVDAIRQSPLPVGIYDRGKHSSVVITDKVLEKLYAEKNVIMIKDSSADVDKRMKIAMAAKKRRPELSLLTGWEFNTIPYLKAGYDGCLLGGGIFNGYLSQLIIDAVKAGDMARAEKLQQRMNRIMFDVYGGKKIACWLSGLKKLMVDMGIFKSWKNFPNYPLTASCQKAIDWVIKKDMDVLMPWKN